MRRCSQDITDESTDYSHSNDAAWEPLLDDSLSDSLSEHTATPTASAAATTTTLKKR